MHPRAPEVVGEEGGEGGLGSEVTVVPDGADVVKHEARLQGVVVDGEGGEDEDDGINPHKSHLLKEQRERLILIGS